MQRVAGLPARHARNGPDGNPSGGRALPGNGASGGGAPSKADCKWPARRGGAGLRGSFVIREKCRRALTLCAYFDIISMFSIGVLYP